MFAGLGMFVGVLFAAPGCGPATPATGSATTVELTSGTGASGTTSNAESDGAATTADATGRPTEPGGTTVQGDRCEEFRDETKPEPIPISIRNDAQIPLFLPFGPCSSFSLFAIQSLSDESNWALGACESTCEVPFCPQDCGSVGSIMIAPGGVVPVFQWDGMVLTPSVLPAECWEGDADMPCDVLRRAGAGDYTLTVGFSKELLGCDPEPCTCDFEGFDFCQIFNKGEPTPQFSAQGVFTMPTAGPIVLSLSL